MSSAITRRSRSDSGHVAVDDPLGEALDDRGLADAGLADQDGVVLGAAGEDLDDAADLVVAPDHRVELAVLGGRVRSRPNFSSAWYFSSGFWSVTRCGPRTSSTASAARRGAASAVRRRRAPRTSASSRCSVEMYSSRSLPASRSAARRTSSSSRAVRGLARAGGDRRQGVERGVDVAADRRPGRRRPCAGRAATMPSLWSSSAASRCSGAVLGVAAVGGQADRGLERLLGLDGEAVELHRRS